MRFSSRNVFVLAIAAILSLGCLLSDRAIAAETSLSAIPSRFSLDGRNAAQQLVVTGKSSGRPIDLTRKATFRSDTPNIVRVSPEGVVAPVGNGQGTVSVSAGDVTVRVSVTVTHAKQSMAVDFDRDVEPILARFGCNSGSCHGKQGGQNGFQLSMFGYDSDSDYNALTQEVRGGRRLFLPDPPQSLLLTKPTGENPHGGGKRLAKGGPEYDLLLRWIRSGTPRLQPDTPALVGLTVEPAERVLEYTETQQLLVTAKYADGSTRDVTRLAAYQSNESAIAAVDEHGFIKASKITGDAAIMARFRDQIIVANVAVPLPGEVPAEFYAKLPKNNFIDELVWKKLELLRLQPSEPAGDLKYHRRVYVDIIGRLPSPTETRAFLADTSTDKRTKLVDRLLERPEFSDYWASKWVDLLRPNPYRAGIKATLNFDFWIRDSFRKNKPYDQFVREILTAQGSTFRNGAVTLFRDRRTPDELTTIVSQLFLGVRLECAKCHHHPFEVYGQKDFYGFAAYFAKVGRKGRGVSPPISGSEETIFPKVTGSVKHPRTDEEMAPKPLFGKAPEIKEGEDPRIAFASWVTSGENPFFVQVMANRVWADMMGRGLVEPVDDLRGTNPASNGPLLAALGDDFRDQGYDLKKLVRRIATSYVYSLSSLPNDRNVVDTRNYSRRYRQRLRAEVLLDAFNDITDTSESFAAMPAGSRAMELWTHRIGNDFLDAFGRPDPNQDPPCERTGDSSVVQVLHLMNSRNLYGKVTNDTSRAAKLAASDKTPAQIVEEIYLWVYARLPDDDEIHITTGLFEKEGITRRQATEDLLWALLNTPEFVFRD
jgi:hypothetical protein